MLFKLKEKGNEINFGLKDNIIKEKFSISASN